MRNAFLFLITLCLITEPLFAGDSSKKGSIETPVNHVYYRGVSVPACGIAISVAFASGLLLASAWRGSALPSNALFPLVSSPAAMEDLGREDLAVVMSAERYYVSRGEIVHYSGTVVPGSQGTIAIAALDNLLIRQDTDGYLHALNPLTQTWIRILDKPVPIFRASGATLAALDRDGHLHTYWRPTPERFSFSAEKGELTREGFSLERVDEGTFDKLLVLPGAAILAVDSKEKGNRRVYIMNDSGKNILQNEKDQRALPLPMGRPFPLRPEPEGPSA